MTPASLLLPQHPLRVIGGHLLFLATSLVTMVYGENGCNRGTHWGHLKYKCPPISLLDCWLYKDGDTWGYPTQAIRLRMMHKVVHKPYTALFYALFLNVWCRLDCPHVSPSLYLSEYKRHIGGHLLSKCPQCVPRLLSFRLQGIHPDTFTRKYKCPPILRSAHGIQI